MTTNSACCAAVEQFPLIMFFFFHSSFPKMDSSSSAASVCWILDWVSANCFFHFLTFSKLSFNVRPVVWLDEDELSYSFEMIREDWLSLFFHCLPEKELCFGVASCWGVSFCCWSFTFSIKFFLQRGLSFDWVMFELLESCGGSKLLRCLGMKPDCFGIGVEDWGESCGETLTGEVDFGGEGASFNFWCLICSAVWGFGAKEVLAADAWEAVMRPEQKSRSMLSTWMRAFLSCRFLLLSETG